MSIREISLEEAKGIERNGMPLGSFIVRNNGEFIGINNESGDSQIITFNEEKKCRKWLMI